jgi:hypothetical protein
VPSLIQNIINSLASAAAVEFRPPIPYTSARVTQSLRLILAATTRCFCLDLSGFIFVFCYVLPLFFAHLFLIFLRDALSPALSGV